MTDQERIKLLREKANWHDQLSRELHASADQLEERHESYAMPELRQRSHGNAQAELSALDVREVSEVRGLIAGRSDAMDGTRTL